MSLCLLKLQLCCWWWLTVWLCMLLCLVLFVLGSVPWQAACEDHAA
jgi:hypothetical protein